MVKLPPEKTSNSTLVHMQLAGLPTSRIHSRPDRSSASFPQAREVEHSQRIKDLYSSQQQEKEAREKSLPAELWPNHDPVMVIPPPHFKGSYPAAPTSPIVCKTRGYISGVGETAVKLVKAHFSQWRGYTHQKSGRFIQPCQHCIHERVLEACEHIERASFQYAGENLMRWQKVTKAEKNRQTAVMRKRRERGVPLTYVSFPLENGRFILLHDAPDIGGQQLPTNRKQLYNLVSSWVLNTPKGKRAGKGLATWGKQPKKADKPEKAKNPTVKEETGKRWRLITEDFRKVWQELTAYEGKPLKGGSFNIPVKEIIDRLDQAGIAWAVESGELPPNVTLNRDKENNLYSAKCDIPPGDDPKNHEGERSEGENAPIPIYLPGNFGEVGRYVS